MNSRSNSKSLLQVLIFGLILLGLSLLSEGLFLFRSRPHLLKELKAEKALERMVKAAEEKKVVEGLTILEEVIEEKKVISLPGYSGLAQLTLSPIWKDDLATYVAGADKEHLSRMDQEKNPTFGMWLYTLGLLAYYQDQTEFAISSLTAATMVEPREEYFMELANYLSWDGKWQEAGQLLEQCRQLSLGDACATFLTEKFQQKERQDVGFLKEIIFRERAK